MYYCKLNPVRHAFLSKYGKSYPAILVNGQKVLYNFAVAIDEPKHLPCFSNDEYLGVIAYTIEEQNSYNMWGKTLNQEEFDKENVNVHG